MASQHMSPFEKGSVSGYDADGSPNVFTGRKVTDTAGRRPLNPDDIEDAPSYLRRAFWAKREDEVRNGEGLYRPKTQFERFDAIPTAPRIKLRQRPRSSRTPSPRDSDGNESDDEDAEVSSSWMTAYAEHNRRMAEAQQTINNYENQAEFFSNHAHRTDEQRAQYMAKIEEQLEAFRVFEAQQLQYSQEILNAIHLANQAAINAAEAAQAAFELAHAEDEGYDDDE